MDARTSTLRPHWSERLLLRLSDSRTIDGLPVHASEGKGKAALDRVEAALALIKTFDRRRFDRVRRDIERVWVRLLPGALARFNRDVCACELDTRFVLDQESTAEIIAAAIVHEATHARLERCGLEYDEEKRLRIEAICVRREHAFLAKLPNGEAARSWVDSHTHETPGWLTDTAFAERTREGEIEVLRSLGTPEWVVRTVLTVAGARLTLGKMLRKLRAPAP